jgi:hypothetical protein
VGGFVKSTIASLQSLTLPFGATEGARIVLDGITGEIRVYDSEGNLSLEITPDGGLSLYDDDGNLRLFLFTSDTGGFAGMITPLVTNAGVPFPGDTPLFVAQDAFGDGTVGRVSLTPGSPGDGFMSWNVQSSDSDDIVPALLQATCETIVASGTLRPIIDLTGPESQSGKEPYTVVHDIWFGEGVSRSNAPTRTGSYPRGILHIETLATVANIGPTVGANVLVCFTSPTITIATGEKRRIRLAFHYRSISETVETDVYRVAFRRDGTIIAELVHAFWSIAATDQYGNTFSWIDDQPAAGNHTYDVILQRIAGAGTATVEVDPTYPAQFYVEDVGGVP